MLKAIKDVARQAREVRGSTRPRKAPVRSPGNGPAIHKRCHDAIVPVFCPTRQAIFVKIEK